jgi:hypothetical protein
MHLGAVLSKFNFLLMAFALVKPNIVERRRCINNSTIVGLLDVSIHLAGGVKDLKKALIRQWMIKWGIIENCLKVVIVNQVELRTDVVGLEVPNVGH